MMYDENDFWSPPPNAANDNTSNLLSGNWISITETELREIIGTSSLFETPVLVCCILDFLNVRSLDIVQILKRFKEEQCLPELLIQILVERRRNAILIRRSRFEIAEGTS